jgi:hypothetical protein
MAATWRRRHEQLPIDELQSRCSAWRFVDESPYFGFGPAMLLGGRHGHNLLGAMERWQLGMADNRCGGYSRCHRFRACGRSLLHVVYHSGDDHRDVRRMTPRDEFPDLQAILHEIQRSKPFASITR